MKKLFAPIALCLLVLTGCSLCGTPDHHHGKGGEVADPMYK